MLNICFQLWSSLLTFIDCGSALVPDMEYSIMFTRDAISNSIKVIKELITSFRAWTIFVFWLLCMQGTTGCEVGQRSFNKIVNVPLNSRAYDHRKSNVRRWVDRTTIVRQPFNHCVTSFFHRVIPHKSYDMREAVAKQSYDLHAISNIGRPCLAMEKYF